MPAAEQRQRQDRAGRDGRRLVDAVAHLEGQLLHRQVLLFRVRHGRGVGRAQGRLQRHRLAEAHVDVAVAPLERAQHADEPAQAFLLLRAAARLVRVVADVGDLVVRDGHRHQQHVVGAAAAPRVHHVRQHAEARRQQLARARPAALDVPLHREALLHQEVDVLAQHELVDGVVLEPAANESLRLDGLLDAQEARMLDEEPAGCEGCRLAAERMERACTWVQRPAMMPPPLGLQAKIMVEVRRQRARAPDASHSAGLFGLADWGGASCIAPFLQTAGYGATDLSAPQQVGQAVRTLLAGRGLASVGLVMLRTVGLAPTWLWVLGYLAIVAGLVGSWSSWWSIPSVWPDGLRRA